MNGRRRYLRPLSLFVLMALFSLSLIGHLDSRLNIGGFEWEEFDDSPVQSHKAEINTEILEDDTTAYDLPELDNPDPVKVASSAVVDNGQDESSAAAGPSSDQSAAEAVDESRTAKPVAKVDENLIPQTQIPSPNVEREKPTVLIHTVRSGETLWDIANSYGITVSQITSANNIQNSNRIRVGQELKILTVKGVLHKVGHGESLWEIAQRYGVSLVEIVDANKISNPSTIQPGMEIVIPGATQLLVKDALVVNGQLQKAFDWPVKGRISSHFGARWGRMHNGLDVAVVTGTPVRAAADGRVTFSGENGGYGLVVYIDHGNQVETRYAHNSRLAVKVGQQVKRGDIIAYSGNTGTSTGPHVHFEIRFKGNPVDPYKYLKD